MRVHGGLRHMVMLMLKKEFEYLNNQFALQRSHLSWSFLLDLLTL